MKKLVIRNYFSNKVLKPENSMINASLVVSDMILKMDILFFVTFLVVEF